ncbi:MAG: translation initiation factor IF-3 [Chitinophagales bacterium]|nr:translation initiation factor IF-3 [Chitinophagales bacterium]MDW8419348.1 translation initiation factor IF-3 [Chitinophagales bacterium]
MNPNSRNNPRKAGGPAKKEPEHLINENIKHPEVRLVGDNVKPGIYPIRKAYELAMEQGLDLVEIAPTANPPVCRIIDYNKFLYEKKRKEKEIKAHAKKVEVKEIRFTPTTDDHDVEFKARHAENFIKEGNKVRAYVMFRGRSIIFKEQGELLLLKFADRLKEVAVVEQLPVLEGKRMFMTLAPKKK